MQEKVEQFLTKKRREQAAADQEKRNETLVKLGLWEKEYGPGPSALPTEYPETDGTRRYRKKAIQVTDEEWAEISKYAREKRVSKLAIVLDVLAVLCCLWGVCSSINRVYDSRFAPLLLGVTLGTLCLGAAELLRR